MVLVGALSSLLLLCLVEEGISKVRRYYIAAVETAWDYTHSDLLSVLQAPAGILGHGGPRPPPAGVTPRYRKAVFVEYPDGSFTQPKLKPAWMGLLGPTIRAEVYDTVVITFKNLASRPYSLHAVGVSYWKASEGAGYEDETSQPEKEGDRVDPGKTHTYVWEIQENQGPTDDDSVCLTHSYSSNTNSVKDINSGLIGALLVCRPGTLASDGNEGQQKEFVLLFAVFDEGKSWYSEQGSSAAARPQAHNRTELHTINGYINGSLPGLTLCLKKQVHWHVIGLGSGPEVHSIFFEGHTFLVRSHRLSSLEISPATYLTAQIMPGTAGWFRMFCQILSHQQAGMEAFVKVEECPEERLLKTGKLLNEPEDLDYPEEDEETYHVIQVRSFAKDKPVTWTYYIAAEEMDWDYAPVKPVSLDRTTASLYLEPGPQRIGSKYKKVVFVEYEDGTFRRRKVSSQQDKGILGPVIKGEVGDQFKIVFRNLASRPYNIYPHGLTSVRPYYARRPSQEKDVKDIPIAPGQSFTYSWSLTTEDGPTEADPRCLTRFYYSSIDPVRDTASGLIGPLLICSKKSMDQRGNQIMSDNMKLVLFSVFDENHSWYLEENIKRFCSEAAHVDTQDPQFYASNVMHTINGFVFDNLQTKLCLNDVVYWYVLSVGAQTDFLSIFFSGNTFKHNMVFEDVLTLFPFSGDTVIMSLEKPVTRFKDLDLITKLSKTLYEQAFLTSITGFKPEKYFWIGLSDVEEQGTFRWASGDPVTFTHWNVGMPGGESGCVAMATGSSAGLWDILDCEETNTFLCKQLVEGVTPPPPPPTTSPLLFCPEGWQSTSQSSFCFKIFQGGREKMQTWFEARDFCRTIGGDLACIHSEEEQNLIARLERDYLHYSFWMGLSALDSDAGFTWSDGSPVNFEKWSHGEPNNYDGSEKCGVFTGYLNMNWNDLFCEHMLDFVCQIKKGTSLKPEPNSTFNYEYVVGEDNWITYKHKEYYFSKEAMSMERARGFCKKNGGDLVVIESETEKKFLWKYIFHKDWGNNFYIGLSVSLDRTFQWMDGTSVNYVAWAPNEPNFANNDENCVVMYTHTGTWNDINCGSVELFICERLNNTVRPTVVPTSPPPKGGCTEDWLLFDNKCFKVFGFNENDTLTWHAARNNCIDFGGNLATISKKEEQAFLMSLLKNAATDAWVGLNDINQEHTYLWTDGSPVDYTNWAKGSRSYYSMDDCVFLMKNPIEQAGKWKDEGCKASKSYICQKSSDPKLLRSQPTVPVFGFNNYGDDRYEVINYKMSWEKAEKNCRDQSAELASILDPYVESFLWLQILKYGEPVWIGLNSNMSGGQYMWSDRRRSRYLNWASGEPNKNKACVYLDLDGFWKTASCNETFLSLCKQSNELIPSEPPQLPGKCPEPKRGRSWIPFRGHCYYVHTTSEESWPDASMMCIQMGASLVSIEDPAEMNFLLLYLSPLASDFRKFWIGLFKNIDGEWIWMDRSAVEYVNWEKGEPTVLFDEHCVDMDVSSGTWRTYYCSVDQNFICKIPKIAEVEPTHDSPINNASINKAAASSSGSLGGMIFILIFLLLAGTGLTLYCFYKRRRDRQMFTAGFDNAIYRGDLGTHESNCLVTNIEENEQETI